MSKRKGTFIVIDGGEGAGKTTVTKAVVEQLGWSAIYSHEPGGSALASKIREVILSDEAKQSDAETQFALFWAARRDHLKHTVIPALNDGKILITDRFDSSSYAYQVIAQEQKQLEKLFWQMREAFVGEYTPDAYILLDVEPEVGLARVKSRGEKLTHFDKRKLDFHQKVNKGLREFVLQKVDKGHAVDASKPVEEVIAEVLEIVSKVADK